MREGCHTGKSTLMVGETTTSSSTFLLPGSKTHYAPNTFVDPKHMDVSMKLDLPEKTIEVELVIIFEGRHPQLSTFVHLNAMSFEGLRLRGVAYEGIMEVPVRFYYDGKQIQVVWDTPFTLDERRAIMVEYKVRNPIAGMYFSNPDKEYPDRPRFVVTDHETERARYWLACVDYPTVRTTFDFRVTANANLTVVANGILQSKKTLDNDSIISHWRLDYPCPSYLCCVAVGEFVVVEDGLALDSIPVVYMASKGTSEQDVRRTFDRTKSMLEWLVRKLATPFPFPKYYQIALPNKKGAMENISLVCWSDLFLLDERLAREQKYLTDIVNIHEMAHSYFGNALVIRHFEHAWLKESWATYMEAAWIEDHLGLDDYLYQLFDDLEIYLHETETYVRPIVTRDYNSSWTMFDMHLYPGGSTRLHLLRRKLGDAVFWKGVQSYVSRFQKLTVETDDFRKCLEHVSGANLTQFFDQWFYKQGYPKLKGTFEFNENKGSLKIVVEQTQANEKDAIGLFNLDIEIEILDTLGVIHTEILHLEEKRGVIMMNLTNSKPKSLRVDPNQKLLFPIDMNPGEDLLIDTIASTADVINRIWAYRQLIKLGSSHVLNKIRDSIIKEPFYGVRIKVAEALAKFRSREAVRLLSEMLLSEQEPRALTAIASFIDFADQDLRENLRKKLHAEQEFSYRTLGRLLEALGHQNQAEDLPYLTRFASDSSLAGYHGLTRAGALKGIAEIRNVEAYEFLSHRLDYGQEMEPVRTSAVTAFARSAHYQEKLLRRQAIEKLLELLRDKDLQVRRAAIEGLVLLEATDSMERMDRVRITFAEQDHAWLDKQLQKLKSVEESSIIHQLTKRIEDLETKQRRLEEQWQDHERTGHIGL
jgi:aminopeptidase N